MNFKMKMVAFLLLVTPWRLFLHPHCYAAEGLLVAGQILNEKSFLESARKAVIWISEYQLDNGAFPSYFCRWEIQKRN